MGKKVAIIVTSCDKLGDHPTGVWSEECTAPYYVMKDAGHDVSVVSIKGGKVPVDAGSLSDTFRTKYDERQKNEDATLFDNVKSISSINVDEVDGIFLSGGHGTCVDFPDGLADLVSEVYAKGKIVAAVCHGPVGLVKAKDGDDSIVKGKKVTGFSDAEEAAVGLTDKVEYTPEMKLRELGGEYSNGDPWTSHAVRDGRLITGQNPQSSVKTAELMLEALA